MMVKLHSLQQTLLKNSFPRGNIHPIMLCYFELFSYFFVFISFFFLVSLCSSLFVYISLISLSGFMCSLSAGHLTHKVQHYIHKFSMAHVFKDLKSWSQVYSTMNISLTFSADIPGVFYSGRNLFYYIFRGAKMLHLFLFGMHTKLYMVLFSQLPA